MGKLSRHTYIDILRVSCSVLVIATHVVMYYINAFETKSLLWTLLTLSKAITQCAVPIFFMISGATLLSSKAQESYTSFIKRRLSKIALPFFAYSVLYFLFYVFIKGEYTLSLVEFFRLFICGGISGHLWYIYALIPLYFLFPILRKLVQNVTKKQLLTFITILFVINSLLPFLNEVLSLFSNFKIGYYYYGKAGVYLNYTLIGFYIHNFVEPNTKHRINLSMYATALLAVGSMTILTWYSSDKKINQTWLDITWPFVVLYSVAVMVLVKQTFIRKPLGERQAHLVSTFGMLSFSAYLVHMLILRTVQIYLPRSVLEKFTSVQSAVALLTILFVGVFISYLWSFTVSKIPLIKKIF